MGLRKNVVQKSTHGRVWLKRWAKSWSRREASGVGGVPLTDGGEFSSQMTSEDSGSVA